MVDNKSDEGLSDPETTPPEIHPVEVGPAQNSEPVSPPEVKEAGEVLDSHTTTQSENPPPQLPIKDNQTTNPKQEARRMELHTPHHLTHKKKWGEYLLEFLMLFLAVFLGFIAENFREQTIEHHREKQFIRSLIEDLKSDTLQSTEVLLKLNNRSIAIDSLIASLSSTEIITNSNNAHRLWSKNLGFPEFISNDRTIQQLKNSGGLRLIQNKAVSDSIMKYDQVLRNYYVQSALMVDVLVDQRTYSQLFDFIALDKRPNDAIPLTEQGRKLLNEAYANRKLWQYALSHLISRLKLVNDESKVIMRFIQKEYEME